jgi:hypothetical protein
MRTWAADGLQDLPRETFAQIKPLADALLTAELTSIGRVFSYSTIRTPDVPYATAWLTVFYRRVFFISLTMLAEDL